MRHGLGPVFLVHTLSVLTLCSGPRRAQGQSSDSPESSPESRCRWFPGKEGLRKPACTGSPPETRYLQNNNSET